MTKIKYRIEKVLCQITGISAVSLAWHTPNWLAFVVCLMSGSLILTLSQYYSEKIWRHYA